MLALFPGTVSWGALLFYVLMVVVRPSLDRWDDRVEIAPAVVRNHDAVNPRLNRQFRAGRVQDSLLQLAEGSRSEIAVFD
jgi:hypothetical protein